MDNFRPKICKQCGKPLQGRSDKLFCDAYCRNTYNNQNRSEGEQTIVDVNSILRRNRKILKELSPMGKSTVRKEVLDTIGYDYRYFSGIYKTTKNQVYYICYDYALSPIKQVDRETGKMINKALIVQKQEYFDKLSLKLW